MSDPALPAALSTTSRGERRRDRGASARVAFVATRVVWPVPPPVAAARLAGG